MKKKSLLKISFLVLLLVIGCKGKVHPITDVDIYTGTDGLTVEFIGNAPPDEVFEKTIFPLGIVLRNEGAYDISNGYLTFSIEEDYMLLDKTSTRTNKRGKKDFEDRFDWIGDERISWDAGKPQIVFMLGGKSIDTIEGEEEIMTLKAEARALDELSMKHESSILATACYSYKTQLVANVCVDTDFYDIKGIVKPCRITDLSFSSQGAPVAVVGVETKMMPMDTPNMIRPQFLIYIQNKGKGLIIEKDENIISDACSEKPLNYSKFGIIYISAFLGGNQKVLNCDITERAQGDEERKTGIVKLKDNMGIARCVLEEGIDEKEGTYKSPLSIELNYGYTHTISKNVVIKKPSKY